MLALLFLFNSFFPHHAKPINVMALTRATHQHIDTQQSQSKVLILIHHVDRLYCIFKCVLHVLLSEWKLELAIRVVKLAHFNVFQHSTLTPINSTNVYTCIYIYIYKCRVIQYILKLGASYQTPFVVSLDFQLFPTSLKAPAPASTTGDSGERGQSGRIGPLRSRYGCSFLLVLAGSTIRTNR